MKTDSNTIRNWVYVIVVIVTAGIAFGALQIQVGENTDHRKDRNVHIPKEEKELIHKKLDKLDSKIDKILERLPNDQN